MNISQIAAIIASACALVCPLAGQAQTPEKSGEAHKTTYEELIISASPHQKTEREIAGSVKVLSGQDLQREVSATLGRTLENQLGVSSSSFGPGVGLPVIRGQSGKRVEILQNSTTIGDVSDLSADHSVATEALLADRIEILRGPATLRYGAGAIGGVVNVIDNRIHSVAHQGLEGAAELRYDSGNDESVAVGRLDAGNGHFGLHLDAVTRESNNQDIPGYALHQPDDPDETSFGYIENSDREADSQGLGLSWVGDTLMAGFSVSRLNNNYGLPPGAHDHHLHEEEGHEDEGLEEEPDETLFTRIDMQQTVYQGKLEFGALGNNFDRLVINAGLTDYDHRELEIEDGLAATGTRFDARTRELSAELLHNEIQSWMGALGIQWSERDLEAFGAEAFVPPSQTDRLGIYLIEETDIGSGALELGARYDDQRIRYSGGEFNHESLNLSASYLQPIATNQRIGLVLSHSERSPVAEELLSDGEHIATNTYEVGDPNLDGESATNLELTWAYDGGIKGVSARASAYYTDFADYVYQRDTELRFSHDLEESGAAGLAACSDELADFDGDTEEFEQAMECFAYTQEDARFHGIEAEVDLPLTPGQRLRFWGDLVRARLDQSGDVPRMPPARIGTNWSYAGELLSARLSLTHAFDQDRPGQGQEATEGYTRLDVHLSYQLRDLNLFVQGHNLTNTEIRQSTSFLREIAPEAGRGISLGARYTF